MSLIKLAAVTMSDAFDAISSAFTFVQENSVLGILLLALVAGTLISIVFSLFRR